MKECIENGCNRPQFGGGYCKYHQYRRKMQRGDQHKRKKQAIPAKSKKRKEDDKRYTEICKELEAEMRSQDPQGRIFDFFSGDEIKGCISWHHIRGRGEYIKDRRWLVPTINKYHLDFHYMPYKEFRKYSWYDAWLNRLKLKDEQSYNKELRRRDKSMQLNPKLFDEDLDN